MMNKLIVLFFLVVGISGCRNSRSTKNQGIDKADSTAPVSILASVSAQKAKQTGSPMDFRSYLVDSAPDRDCQVINEKAVVFVFPDSIQIETMKKEEGDTNFYVAADDANWYWSEAHEFLTKKTVKVIEAEKRYLKFEAASGPIFFDTKAGISEGWIVILFRRDSLPQIIKSVDIEQEYEKYFGNE